MWVCAREGSGARVLGSATKEPGSTLAASGGAATSVKTSPRAERKVRVCDWASEPLALTLVCDTQRVW